MQNKGPSLIDGSEGHAQWLPLVPRRRPQKMCHPCAAAQVLLLTRAAEWLLAQFAAAGCPARLSRKRAVLRPWLPGPAHIVAAEQAGAQGKGLHDPAPPAAGALRLAPRRLAGTASAWHHCGQQGTRKRATFTVMPHAL